MEGEGAELFLTRTEISDNIETNKKREGTHEKAIREK